MAKSHKSQVKKVKPGKAPVNTSLGPDGRELDDITSAEAALASELFGKPEEAVLEVSAGRKRLREPKQEATKAPPKAAWVDEDDEDIKGVNLAATARLRKLRSSLASSDAVVSGRDFESRLRERFLASKSEKQAAWADVPLQEEEDESTEVLRSAAPLTRQGEREHASYFYCLNKSFNTVTLTSRKAVN